LPAWAIGTFDGYVKIEPADTMVATATMTVSATAKISGKFKLGAKSYSFTAPSFKEKVSDDVYSAETIIKIGKDTINMDLQITRAASLDPTAFATLGTAEGGFEQEGEEYSLRLSRNIWKDAGATALLDPFVGYYTAAVLPDAGDTYGSGYLTFTIDKKGSVKTAGKLADGTSVSLSSILMGVDTNLTYTLLHVTPSGYKGGWFSGMIPFEIIDAEPVILTSVADAWCSLNPQATGEYEEGFLRDADIAGGWYDKLINLRAYFEDGIEVGGIVLPELLAAVKTTDWNPDNPSKKITTTANELINAMEDASPVGLILGLTPATGIATGFVAPANDAPTKLPDGSYDYTVDKNGDGQSNTSGLTFKFTRATGLFSGKFSIWYDYVSAQDLTTDKETLKHESKSASFQGVITPTATDGTAGRGYYLWADQSEYDTGKTDKNGNPVMKSYKYNNSFDFLLLVP
jgi:hypothetical protein